MKQFFTRPDPPLQWSLEISLFVSFVVKRRVKFPPLQPRCSYNGVPVVSIHMPDGIHHNPRSLTFGASYLFDLTKLSLTLCESPPSVMQKWCNWAGKPTSFVGPVRSPQHVAALCVQASPSMLASRHSSFLWTASQQHSSMHVHCRTFPSSKEPMCSIGDKVNVGSFDVSVF